jgi:hypothetical protein
VELAAWLGNSSVAAEFEQHREFGTRKTNAALFRPHFSFWKIEPIY